MRWKSGRRSSNIEDRRGVRISKKTAAGGLKLAWQALIWGYAIPLQPKRFNI